MNGKRNKATRGKKITKLEFAYIAGLLDGEGCINISRTKTAYLATVNKMKIPKYQLSVTIYNCHEPTLRWLHECFGGYFQIRVRARTNPKWKLGYAWKLTANVALEFLREMKSYLKIKKAQAELAIKFQEDQSRFHKTKAQKAKKSYKGLGVSDEALAFRETCYQQMRELNKKGFSPAETKRTDS